MVDEPNFSSSALRVLNRFYLIKQDLPWLMSYCSADGGLVEDMEQFLRSLGKCLRSEFALYGWHQSFEKSKGEDSGVDLKMFPANWDLSGLGPIQFRFTWRNPFVSKPADRYLCVEVAAPREWRNWEKLKDLLRPKLTPERFTDLYEPGDPDPSGLFWKYIPFDQFVSESGVDVPLHVAAIKDAVKCLVGVRSAIDAFLANCEPGSSVPQETADLRVTAFLDTETTGLEPSSEIIELAILNAACDPITGEVLGILEQYVGQREPRMVAPQMADRASGLTSNFLFGKTLDEDRVRNLLTRADCIVAHNASFDRRMLSSLYPWVANLNWKCSLNGVKWQTEVGMSEKNLQGLMGEYRIKTEGAHRAHADALGMLQLLSRRHAGKTLLAHVLGW